MQCGLACVEIGSTCSLRISPSAKAAAKLIRKTIETEKIPSRSEIAELAGTVVGEAARNPIKFIREGNQREAFVRGSLSAVGYKVDTKAETTAKKMKKAAKSMKRYLKDNPQVVEDLIVNTGGFVGSQIGGATAGPLGQLGGDLGGALIVRKGFDDYKALGRARKTLKDDEAFKKANLLAKLGMIKKRSAEELKQMAKDRETNAAGDIAGFVVGNSTAMALQNAPIVGGVPLKGALVAMPVTPELVKGYQRLKAGEPAGTVVKDVAKSIASIPQRMIEAGNQRERDMRNKLELKLKNLKRELTGGENGKRSG